MKKQNKYVLSVTMLTAIILLSKTVYAAKEFNILDSPIVKVGVIIFGIIILLSTLYVASQTEDSYSKEELDSMKKKVQQKYNMEKDADDVQLKDVEAIESARKNQAIASIEKMNQIKAEEDYVEILDEDEQITEEDLEKVKEEKLEVNNLPEIEEIEKVEEVEKIELDVEKEEISIEPKFEEEVLVQDITKKRGRPKKEVKENEKLAEVETETLEKSSSEEVKDDFLADIEAIKEFGSTEMHKEITEEKKQTRKKSKKDVPVHEELNKDVLLELSNMSDK